MTDCVFVYVTCANAEEARRIARAAVEEKRAACANIFPAHESIYRWQGKIENTTETAMILKTTSAGFDDLKNRIVELHSYECPCVVALDIKDGHAGFLDWIVVNTGLQYD